MVNQSWEWQPILPYPSPASALILLVAMIERSTGVDMPEDWPDCEPYYLDRRLGLQTNLLVTAIQGAIQGAEPGDWLSEELKYFEHMIAEYALEDLQSTPAGQVMLDAIRAQAREQFHREQMEQDGQADDE